MNGSVIEKTIDPLKLGTATIYRTDNVDSYYAFAICSNQMSMY